MTDWSWRAQKTDVGTPLSSACAWSLATDRANSWNRSDCDRKRSIHLCLARLVSPSSNLAETSDPRSNEEWRSTLIAALSSSVHPHSARSLHRSHSHEQRSYERGDLCSPLSQSWRSPVQPRQDNRSTQHADESTSSLFRQRRILTSKTPSIGDEKFILECTLHIGALLFFAGLIDRLMHVTSKCQRTHTD